MVIYRCPRCLYETNRKSNIRNHIYKKKQCENNNNLDIDLKEYEEYIYLGKNELIENLIRKIKLLESKIISQNINTPTQNTTNITNNYININIDNISLCNYNDTDITNIDILNEQNIIKICTKYKEKIELILCEIIKICYFNTKIPRNNNICLTNLSRNVIYVYNNEKWKLENKREFIKKLIKNVFILIQIYNSKQYDYYYNLLYNNNNIIKKEITMTVERNIKNYTEILKITYK